MAEAERSPGRFAAGHPVRRLRRFEGTLIALLVVVLACAPGASAEQAAPSGVIEGLVVDGGRYQPGIEVYLSGTSLGTVTDSLGRFRFEELGPGTYRVAVSLVGAQGPVAGPPPVVVDLEPDEVERVTLRIRVPEEIVRRTPPAPLAPLRIRSAPPEARPAARRPERVALLLQVTSAETGEPIAGVAVSIEGVGGMLTNADGRARWDGIAAGEHVLALRHPSFGTHERRVRVGREPVEIVEVALSERAIRIEGLEVVGRRRGFEGRLDGFHERMETHSGGRFVTRAQLAPRDSQPLMNVLQSLIPNLRQQCVMRGSTPFCRLESARHLPSLRGSRCRLAYYLDGVRFEMPEWTNIEEVFRPWDIEAVEFYPGAGTTPVEFNSPNGRCGVLVLWSREPGPEAEGGPDRR